MQDDRGSTALIIACEKGNSSVARLLVERGAAINYQDKVGLLCVTVLYIQCSIMCTIAMALIIAWCARVALSLEDLPHPSCLYSTHGGDSIIVTLYIVNSEINLLSNCSLTHK